MSRTILWAILPPWIRLAPERINRHDRGVSMHPAPQFAFYVGQSVLTGLRPQLHPSGHSRARATTAESM